MQRNLQRRAGLPLPHFQESVADVLAAHADDVAAPLAGVKQEAEAEPNQMTPSNCAIWSSNQARKPQVMGTRTRMPVVGSRSQSPAGWRAAISPRSALPKFFLACGASISPRMRSTWRRSSGRDRVLSGLRSQLGIAPRPEVERDSRSDAASSCCRLAAIVAFERGPKISRVASAEYG
jgi:hypothetical protein